MARKKEDEGAFPRPPQGAAQDTAAEPARYAVPEPNEERRAFAQRTGIPDEAWPLLCQALTHRSISEAQRAPSGQIDNERLEFLGDSILGMLIGEEAYHSYPDYTEGQLTRVKARLVSEPALAEAAERLGLGPLIHMAPGELAAGARERPGPLADAFEAILAVIYLAKGLGAARAFVAEHLLTRVDLDQIWDFKSHLQEFMQEKRRATPAYRIACEIGPAHDRQFVAEVLVRSQVLGRGQGRSKKVAEQAAAADALASVDRLGRRKRRSKS